ncbi:hypothetical protein AOLI_G00189520 [Acnodon oligacanthus]
MPTFCRPDPVCCRIKEKYRSLDYSWSHYQTTGWNIDPHGSSRQWAQGASSTVRGNNPEVMDWNRGRDTEPHLLCKKRSRGISWT